jgi:hypothetical protein
MQYVACGIYAAEHSMEAPVAWTDWRNLLTLTGLNSSFTPLCEFVNLRTAGEFARHC